MACMMRVLDFGQIDKIRAGTYETTVRAVKNFANPDINQSFYCFCTP
jgi:hypothetical protein